MWQTEPGSMADESKNRRLFPALKRWSSRHTADRRQLIPTRINNRWIMPRVNTATSPIHSTVITAIQLSKAEADTLFHCDRR